MMTKGPQWWQIYVLGAMMPGLLLLAHFTFTDVTARHIAQIGIVLIGYGLLLTWLGSQARAIEREDGVPSDYGRNGTRRTLSL